MSVRAVGHVGGGCRSRGVASVVDRGEHADRVARLLAQQRAEPVEGGAEGVLRRLCEAAAKALSASGVGVSVMLEDGTRGLAVASDPVSERVEELQFLLGEGPCVDAFATRRPVLVPDLADGAMSRWPMYAPAAYGPGVRAVFAFPLQVGAARLGVLDVFRTEPGHLSADDLSEALTFADVAVMSLLDGQDNARPDAAVDWLDGAIDGRAALFQAQGMLSVQLGGSLTEAMSRMRAHAYAEDRRLDDVARDIVARRLQFDQDHA